MKYIKVLCFATCLISFNASAQDLSDLKNQKPVSVSGTIDVRAIGYSSKGIPPRRNPFTWVVSGAPTLSLYGIDIPVSFTFTEQDRSFAQPFNQIGMSPTYKWVTLHAGYRNLTFSPYTLAGHTMLGGGFELKPGNFRVAVMTGRLNRATTVDSTTGAIRPYSFSRFGTAAKIGYGGEKTTAEISVLSARDSEKDFKGDTLTSTLRPAANLVLGAELKHTFPLNLFVFADGGLSVYTEDRYYDLKIDVDSAYRKLKPVNALIGLNASSEYYMAYSGGVGYQHKLFNVRLAYKYVDPNFRSMGAYFFQNDLENVTISPSFNVLKGKLRFSGSLGIQRDNVKRTKYATTRRIIGMGNLSWDIIEKLGIDINYTNFSSNAQPTVTMIENRYLLAQTNRNLSVTPRLMLPGKTTTQVVLLSYNRNNMKDLNEQIAGTNDILSQIAFLNYNVTFNRLKMSVMPGLSYTSNRMAGEEINNMGATLGASKSWLKNKLTISTQNSYMLSETFQGKGTILNFGGNLSYMPFKGHRMALRVNALKSQRKREEEETITFSENTGEISYTYSF